MQVNILFVEWAFGSCQKNHVWNCIFAYFCMIVDVPADFLQFDLLNHFIRQFAVVHNGQFGLSPTGRSLRNTEWMPADSSTTRPLHCHTVRFAALYNDPDEALRKWGSPFLSRRCLSWNFELLSGVEKKCGYRGGGFKHVSNFATCSSLFGEEQYPNDWTRPSFGGVKAKKWGQTGSR